jgi:hypothetical protein
MLPPILETGTQIQLSLVLGQAEGILISINHLLILGKQ